MRREPSVKPSGRSVSVRIIRERQSVRVVAWAETGARSCSSCGSDSRLKSCSVPSGGAPDVFEAAISERVEGLGGDVGVGVF